MDNGNRTTMPCLICEEESPTCFEYFLIHKDAQVCSRCADIVANVYSMKHSGQYITWPNQTTEPEAGRYRARKIISAKVRKLVLERDHYRCVKCGSHIDLQIDHRFPHIKGGSDEPDNLQTLCKPCNRAKKDRIEVAA